MSALPQPGPAVSPDLPDYLPARMVNEFVYCPRLFYYEWVDSLFRGSADTVEGTAQHKRVDQPSAMPGPENTGDGRIHSRSATLSSDRLRVVAKMDLVEIDGGVVTPVDYKHGRPRASDDGLELWPADRAQLALQGMILRENGYACEEAIVYYTATKQRVRLPLTPAVIDETERAVAGAWAAAGGSIPPPLEDSPKCPGCSLVGICLPDETNTLLAQTEADDRQLPLFGNVAPRRPPGREVRALVTPRCEQRPVYLNTQGLRVGKSGEVLEVKEKDKLVQQVRLGEICQLNLLGNVQLTTQAVQQLCWNEVPVCYFSQGGWFYGLTSGMGTKNIFLRRQQFRLADVPWFGVQLARRLVAAKVRNQRTMLQRNHVEPPAEAVAGLKRMAEMAERARDLEELLGIEGYAARIYFGNFAGMVKADEAENGAEFTFDFAGRNRRPPRDPVNALLSLAYSLLAKDMTVASYAVGFDPMMGYYHQPRHGRPALALDLMEPFRPLVADSAVLSAINTRMVTAKDFVQAGTGVALTPNGRSGFFRAYELRMDTLVTHPAFDYRVSYRRLLEIQSRLLARVVEGELTEYPAFVTR
jgi:CRISP-associated protein Cas1